MITVHIFKDNKVEKIDFDKLSKEDLQNKIWIDISEITKEQSEKIRDLFDIHKLVIEDFLYSIVLKKTKQQN